MRAAFWLVAVLRVILMASFPVPGWSGRLRLWSYPPVSPAEPLGFLINGEALLIVGPWPSRCVSIMGGRSTYCDQDPAHGGGAAGMNPVPDADLLLTALSRQINSIDRPAGPHPVGA